MPATVIVGYSLLVLKINKASEAQQYCPEIITAIIGVEKPPVKLQKSLFSGIETHSREACNGVRARRGMEPAVSRNRIVRGFPNQNRTRVIAPRSSIEMRWRCDTPGETS